MSHPSVARSLVLETTLFPEDVSLDRLQALLDQWEGDAPAAPFDSQAGWRAFRRAHPTLFPRHPAGRALPWLAGAAAALAVALTGTDLLTPAPEEQGPSVSVSLDPQEAWRYAPLYDLLGVRTLGAALPPLNLSPAFVKKPIVFICFCAVCHSSFSFSDIFRAFSPHSPLHRAPPAV